MDVNQLSKIISHALRHDPTSYNLILDSNGWVELCELVTALKQKGVETSTLEIIKLVNDATKIRHEIVHSKIRACYGHSIQTEINRSPELPPKILFHGTLRDNLPNILKLGISPMMRQFVHLSSQEEEARIVASRKNGEVIILKINSFEAYNSGVKFYKEKNNIWLVDYVKPEYIVM